MSPIKTNILNWTMQKKIIIWSCNFELHCTNFDKIWRRNKIWFLFHEKKKYVWMIGSLIDLLKLFTYLIHSPLTSLRSKQPHIGQSPRLLGDIFFTVSGLCLFRDVVGESGYSSSAILVCGFTLNECERLASRPVEPYKYRKTIW